MEQKIILVMLGPPGSGKGTQASILAKKLNIPALSTGQLLRDLMENEPHNPLSIAVKDIINNGHFVSDEMMINILRAKLSSPECDKGVILDGFPRNLVQADVLEQMVRDLGGGKFIVIFFGVTEQALIKRLSGRLSCAVCKHQYHAEFKKPKIEGVCDECGATEFHVRPDDSADAVRNRLVIYNQSTLPLLDFYRKKGTIIEIEAEGEIQSITERIVARLQEVI